MDLSLLLETLNDMEKKAIINGDEHPSINNKMLNPIYVLTFSYTKPDNVELNKIQQEYDMFRKVVKAMTLGEDLSHSSISLDSRFNRMYTITGNHSNVIDNIYKDNGPFDIVNKILIYVLFLTDEELDRAQKAVEYIMNTDKKGELTYNLVGCIRQMLGKSSKSHSKSLVCSTVIGYILNAANPKLLHRDWSMLRPADMTILPRSFFIGEYTSRNNFIESIPEIKQKTFEIYRSNKQEIMLWNNILPKSIIVRTAEKNHNVADFFNSLVNKLT